MYTSLKIENEIMRRIRSYRRDGWVSISRDFLDLGSRHAIDKALSRLVKKHKLVRIARGMYTLPSSSTFLRIHVIRAIIRRDNIRVMISGMEAAYRLQLSDQEPEEVVYLTDGVSRVIHIDGEKLVLQHASSNTMFWANQPAGPVVQALRWLRENQLNNNDNIIVHLKRILPHNVKHNLLRNVSHMPVWMVRMVQKIAISSDEF